MDSHLQKETFSITRSQRESLNAHPAFVLWLTGLSGAGKSTLADHLDQAFYALGIRSFILDGDNTRLGLNRDLDFSRAGRQENIRRVAETARLLNEAGVVVISSFISPFVSDRETARQIIGREHFIEIFVDASLSTCKDRDTKGLYQLAEQGLIQDFTGISSPYEPPTQPAIRVSTDHIPVSECVSGVMAWLYTHHLIDRQQAQDTLVL